jgi:malate synthase
MNDNTILRIKVPAHLYESVKKQLTLTEAQKGGKAYGDWTVVKEKKAPKDGMKKVEEEKVEEAAPGVEYAWIPAAAAGLGIAASVIKAIVGYMKDNNLKGMQGFLRAYKEVGKDASSTIDKKMGGNMEEAKEEKKEEDK